MPADLSVLRQLWHELGVVLAVADAELAEEQEEVTGGES